MNHLQHRRNLRLPILLVAHLEDVLSQVTVHGHLVTLLEHPHHPMKYEATVFHGFVFDGCNTKRHCKSGICLSIIDYHSPEASQFSVEIVNTEAGVAVQ